MRSPAAWLVAILAGIGIVIGATALIGWSDNRDETVPAVQWANDVCGAVEVWRAELEGITDQFRSEGEIHADMTREDLRGSVRLALSRTVVATDTLIEGIRDAGTPDSEGGQQTADDIESWADSAKEDLDNALEEFEDAGDEPGERLDAIAATSAALASTLTEGFRTLTQATQDPELRAAAAEAPRCSELQGQGG